MIDISKIARENVLRLTPYSCARDEFRGSSGIFLDANENPYGNLNRYPDPYQLKLKSMISGKKGIPAERIFLGNGSDEVIDLCFRVFCNPGKDRVLIFPPTYGMYEVSASINDVGIVKVNLDENFRIDLQKTEEVIRQPGIKLVFICSPNNPTANAMDPAAVEWIISNFNGIIVIDEAYADFSEKPSFTGLLEKYNNLVVMQTFSKAMGMAAGRVGMAFTDPEIVKLLNKIKPPYNISTINQEAAASRIINNRASEVQIGRIKKERERLAQSLKEFSFVRKVFPSDANFLLVKVDNANNLYEYLVSRNIIVRNRHSVIENCIRITVGKRTENNLLINILKNFTTENTESTEKKHGAL